MCSGDRSDVEGDADALVRRLERHGAVEHEGGEEHHQALLGTDQFEVRRRRGLVALVRSSELDPALVFRPAGDDARHLDVIAAAGCMCGI